MDVSSRPEHSFGVSRATSHRSVIKTVNTTSLSISTPPLASTSTTSNTFLSVSKSSLWSVRGRFGIITSDVYHLYGTIGVGGEKGGYNYSDVHTANGLLGDFTPSTAGSLGISSIGLVYGAGAEWKILPYIVLRAEYLHYAVASNTALPQNTTPITGILTGPGLGDHVHLGDADVVRVGASWLFNFGH